MLCHGRMIIDHQFRCLTLVGLVLPLIPGGMLNSIVTDDDVLWL